MKNILSLVFIARLLSPLAVLHAQNVPQSPPGPNLALTPRAVPLHAYEEAYREQTASYNEPMRPQFHFTAPKGRMNDPNGLLVYQDEFHLFYQFNQGQGGCWGHAVSKDWLHWEHLPVALPAQGSYPAFSGSVVLDKDNSAGFQSGTDKALVALYTRWGKGQYLAYSNDRGRTWKDYESNPVIALPNDDKTSWPDSARDPRVIWHEGTKRWVAILYEKVDGKGGFGFFSSTDLKQWTFESHLPGFYVCPDLFQLPVQGETGGEQPWVIMDWGDYGIGTFDGHRFEMQGRKRRLDAGNAYSANQTWWDASGKEGRRVQIAWLRSEKQVAGAPFDQQLTFPCQLSLQRQPDGIRLCRSPIPEISRLHTDESIEKAKTLLATKSLSSLVENDTLDISLDIQPSDGGTFSLLVRGIAIDYNVRNKLLSFLGNTASLPLMPDGHLRLRILVDRLSVEVFGNNGLVSMTSYAELDPKMRSVFLRSLQGEHLIHELRVAKIESIWKGMSNLKQQ